MLFLAIIMVLTTIMGTLATNCNHAPYAAWSDNAQITFQNGARSALIDIPVHLDLSTLDSRFWNKVQNDGDDIRFVDPSGAGLSYELEAINTGTETGAVFFEVPRIDGNDVDYVCLYWGNGIATNGEDTANTWTSYDAVYHLYETNGNIADSSGNNGAPSENSLLYEQDGYIYYGIETNADSDYLIINQTQDGTSSTIELWFKPTSLATDGAIFDTGGYYENGLLIYAKTDGDIDFYGASSTLEYSATNALTIGVWTHIIVTLNHATTRAEIWVDGTKQTDSSFATWSGASSNKISYGEGYNGLAGAIGTWDEIRYYDSIFSNDWIDFQITNQNGTPGYSMEYSGSLYTVVLTNLSMTPTTAYTNDTLSYYATCTGNESTYTLNYIINKDGVAQIDTSTTINNATNTLITTTVPASTTKGETWQINATCEGSYGNSSNEVASETIQNLVPIIQTSRYMPTSPLNTSDLIGYCKATDEDGEALNYTYTWYVNGTTNATGTSNAFTEGIEANIHNLTSTNTQVFQNWTLQCVATDGDASSSAINSSTHYIDSGWANIKTITDTEGNSILVTGANVTTEDGYTYTGITVLTDIIGSFSTTLTVTPVRYYTFMDSITINHWTTTNYSLSEPFNTNFTMIDSTYGTSIEPTCTWEGRTFTDEEFSITQNNTLSCEVFGYDDKTFNIGNASLPQTLALNMTPVSFNLIFTELTEGWVDTETCTLSHDCYNFNATEVSWPQANVSIGYVTVRFNPDGSENWQQVYEYYNDGDTTLTDYILIETPDLAKTIKVSDDGDPVEGARVCSKRLGTNPDTNLTDWLTTYCVFTDEQGEAILLVNDQNDYQFCIQKTGYTATCEQHYLTPSETIVSVIEIELTEAEAGTNYFWSNCTPFVDKPTTCELNIWTGKTYSAITADYFTNSTNGTETTVSSTGATFTFAITDINTHWIINISLDGTYVRTFDFQLGESFNGTADIDFEQPDSDGLTMKQKLEANKEYYIAFHIIVLILGAIMGWLGEKYFKRYGIYSTALWFFIWAGPAEFGLFWIPTILIAAYALWDKFGPMVK